MNRIIITTPGIGDILFLFQKLINQKEKFHWKINDGKPQRGHQIFDLFPQLSESWEYIPDAGYKKLKRSSYNGSWVTSPKKQMILEVNSHLEAGRRIEDFLPDLSTSFILPFATSHEDKKKAEAILPFKHYIGIYTTSYSNSEWMGGWVVDQWFRFLRLIHDHFDHYKFVFIGAHYDRGITQEVMKRLPSESYINTVGDAQGSDTLLPVVIEMMKRMDMFIGFQSGLLIANELVGAKQTIMLYNNKLEDMMNTWPDQKRIDSGRYKGCHFGSAKHPLTPDALYHWMIENKVLNYD